MRGAADVNVEKVSGLAYLQIEIDREKIARYGINVADVHDVIETAIGGKEASKVYEGLKVFGLAVRFPESARNDVEPIREILIPSPSGALIPLRSTRERLCHRRPRANQPGNGATTHRHRVQRNRSRHRRICRGGANRRLTPR